jgi:hypothetical protein
MKMILWETLRSLFVMAVLLACAVTIAVTLMLAFGGCMTARPQNMKTIVVRSGPEVQFDTQLKRIIVIPGPLVRLDDPDGGTTP